jgi:hypothetical protein
LETYLLALLKLVEEKENKFNRRIIIKTFTGRMHFQTKKFNVEWLKIKDEPDENTFMNSKTNSSTDKTKVADIGDYYNCRSEVSDC